MGNQWADTGTCGDFPAPRVPGEKQEGNMGNLPWPCGCAENWVAEAQPSTGRSRNGETDLAFKKYMNEMKTGSPGSWGRDKLFH